MAENRPLEATADTRHSGLLRLIGQPCSARYQRSQAMRNGLHGFRVRQNDNQASQIGSPTILTICESRLPPPFTRASRGISPASVQATLAEYTGPRDEAHEVTLRGLSIFIVYVNLFSNSLKFCYMIV
ncbi:hypothetical protein DPMN_016429 [Dreissena polymorpha]|uniref:Uncharacterized protein n=1 Tax=Dreissena polymorpha TaxID=45954 RepID=A0A9D4NEK6_DREPO|nr:hypothetical protein DPMN_016429 [Dreissena polymorpha]